MKKRIFYVLLSLFLLTAGSIYFAKWFNKNYQVKESYVDIFEGASVKQVTELLELSGSVRNADVLFYYIRLKQLYYDLAPWKDSSFDVSFKVGKFLISEGNFDTLINTLNDAKNAEVILDSFVTIPEGSTIDEFATILSERGILKKENFIDFTNDQNLYNSLRDKYLWLPEYNEAKRNQLEGFLQANTYDINQNTKAHEIISKMIEETDKWYQKYKVEISSSKFSFAELLTLASIIERESKFEEDRPKVSQVFHNRLNIGMKLESDITAAYANDEHKTFMTYEDINTDSPYNTYKIDGLPIGPINAPSLQSFEAALKPIGEDFKALYFYARPSGETFYSETYEEHEQTRLKYEQEWLDLD